VKKFVCCLLFVCGAAFAQPGSYAYTAPPGWSVETKPGGLTVLLPGGEATPTASVLLMPVKKLEADFDAQFESERRLLESMLGLREPQHESRQQGSTIHGRHKLYGAQYASAQGERRVIFMARASKGALGMELVIATTLEGYQRHARAGTDMFNGLRLTDQAAALAGSGTSGAANTSAGTPATGAPSSARPKGLLSQPTVPASTSPLTNLSFSVPPGWTQSGNGLTSAPGPMSGKRNTLEVLPGERLQGSPTQTFAALWPRIIGTRYQSGFHPLPLRLRLTSGAALFFDGDHDARERSSNAQVGAFLYLVTDGNTVVPVVATICDWNEIRRDLKSFFDSVRLGGGRYAGSLYAQAEVTGIWRTSSSSLASYVDLFGNYRGDASLATGETLTIAADGTCSSQFAAVGGGGGRMRASGVGRCPVEDDTLVEPSERGPRRYRISGVGHTPDGKAGFLLLGITRDDYPFLDSGSQMPGAGDVYVSQP